MDWLTADLVFNAILVTLGIMGLCTICGSLLWWCCMEEGRREWRIWWRRRQQRKQLSASWWRHQESLGDRVEFHGPAIRWPIRKEE